MPPEYKDNEITEKSVFNYGKFKVYFMANLSVSATRSFISGDILNWYYNLRALKNNIKSSLTSDEFSRFNKVESIINQMSSMIQTEKSFDDKDTSRINRKIMKKLFKYIDIYDTLIANTLDKKGYGDQYKTDDSILFGDN